MKINFTFTALVFLLICTAPSVAFTGSPGVGSEAGLSLFTPNGINSPSQIAGLTGGLRVFYGINGTIGVEAMLHGTNMQSYTPLVAMEKLREEDEQIFISMDPVLKPRQQKYSLGLVYNLDLFRLTPSLGLGFSRVRTGARTVSNGQSVMDNHLYLFGALDYQIGTNWGAGFVCRFSIPLTDSAFVGTTSSFLFRLSYIWSRKKLQGTTQR